MSFKIIAIRPLKECSQRFYKNLNPGELYPFYNDYTFHTKKGEVASVDYSPSIPARFFNIDRIKRFALFDEKNDPIKVNVSAVVGKNGSGKSALSELFTAALFIISYRLGFVREENFLNYENPLEVQRYDDDLPEVLQAIACEIYYHIDNTIYKLQICKNEIHYDTATGDTSFTFRNDAKTISDKSQLPHFFYTMVINYSFYSFNTNQIGMWIKAFFHKNDGYQMPIVINPYRDEGVMNINTENVLTRARVLANILTIAGYKSINPKSSIKHIELFYNSEKDYQFLKDGRQRFTDDFIIKFRQRILMPLFEKTFNNEYRYPRINSAIKRCAELYLIKKLITIPSRYDIFGDFDKRRYRKRDGPNNYKFHIKNAEKYVEELKKDGSHITLKVKQTLNFLRNDIFGLTNFSAILKVGAIEKAMQDIREKDWFTEIVDYLPPPFLTSKITFEDNSDFEMLSSGEKQKIYSLNSIIYHLNNLDSVHNNRFKNEDKGIISYNTVNLIFDEVELYFHPEFQKSVFSELLKFIASAQFKYIDYINMIFLTHSPFILSDIPNQNILYIERGSGLLDDRPINSFGANITDLLAHSFFIKDGLLGDFAKEKIGITLNWLKIKANQWHRRRNRKELRDIFEVDESIPILKFESSVEEMEYHRQVIDLIDEPLVKNKLKELYIDYVSPDSFYLDEELQKAEQRVSELKARKKNRK